jgi:hypothetical protein
MFSFDKLLSRAERKVKLMPIGRPSKEEARVRVNEAIKIAQQSGDVSMMNIRSIVRQLAEKDAKRDVDELIRQKSLNN